VEGEKDVEQKMHLQVGTKCGEVTGSLIVQFIGYTQVSLGLLSGYHTPIGDDERMKRLNHRCGSPTFLIKISNREASGNFELPPKHG
jgi:hypothetical protein